jgi:two-component system cell cycle response regulator DivK
MNKIFVAKKILVVEDNQVNQKLMQKIISIIGHEFINGGDGENIDVIKLVKEQKPAIILMDVQLIGVSGVDLTKQLKSDPETTAIPVIMITALSSSGDRERIIVESKCDDFMSKPFLPEDLANKVEQFLPIKKISWN